MKIQIKNGVRGKSGGGGNAKEAIISIALIISLITTSIPPRAAEASWFSDVFGGLFTFITAPIWIFCQDNPTFRKNNPFREKVWEEEERIERQKSKPPRIERFSPTTPTIDSDLQQREEEKTVETEPTKTDNPRLTKIKEVKFEKSGSGKGRGLSVNYSIEEKNESDSTIKSKHYTDFAKEYPQEWEQLKQEDSHHWEWIQYGIHRESARILLVDSNGAAVTEYTPKRKQLMDGIFDIVERNSYAPYIISLMTGGIRYNEKRKRHASPFSTVPWDKSVNNKDILQAQLLFDGLSRLLSDTDKITEPFGYAIWNPAAASFNLTFPLFTGFPNKDILIKGLEENFKVPEHYFLLKDIQVKEDKEE